MNQSTKLRKNPCGYNFLFRKLGSFAFLYVIFAMEILHSPVETRQFVNRLKASGKRVGFVPTMGALHEGHASLVRRSVEDNDITVASIFVNPTQFGEGEDFDRYPRDLEKDASLLRELGTDLIFAPGVAEMYPEGKGNSQITFNVGRLGSMMDGEKRPGHFQGSGSGGVQAI